MSFPYKIRKVAWGSCKPSSNESDIASTTTNNNFDPTIHLGGNSNDPHTIGGNLQRAILLDLIELRHRYYTAVSQAATTANNSNNTKHTTTGISFGQFKECFREARFGAIHSRTIPARVDRREYVQLLYSSCFYLLEQAFDTAYNDNQSQEVVEEVGNASSNHTLNWNDDEHNTNSAFHAIYAIFILYTLHKTNILPKPPPNTLSSASKNYNEQSLQNSWSMLPIGINNNDEDKLYRRTFHGRVRIDRYNYMLLLQLRELCLVRMEQCDIGSKKIEFSSNTSAESDTTTTTTAPWQCNCSLARDAVYILDSMLSSNDDDNDFFEYCEYHGPHSLEGLSGSSNFYRAYFSNNNQKSTQSNNVDSATNTHAAVCNESEMNEMIHDDTLDIQSLSQLVKGHQSNLATVMSQLHKSRLTKDDELQPRQRELVENTLKAINKPNEELPLQLLASDKNTANDKAKSPESSTLPKTKTTIKHVSILQFPGTFSTILCNEIRSSLEVDFRNEIDMIRKDVIKNKRKDEVRMNQQVVIDYGDDFASIGKSEPVKRRPSDIANVNEDEASSLGRKRQRCGVDDELDLEEDVERDDELSIATGGGRNALYSLLSMVDNGGGGGSRSDGSNDEDDSIATTEAGHKDKTMPPNNSKSHLPMASIDDDDASVVSGMGTRALQFLLSHQSPKKQNKKQAEKKRTKSCRKAPPKEDKNEDVNESPGEEASSGSGKDISVAAGTNALATLLAHV